MKKKIECKVSTYTPENTVNTTMDAKKVAHGVEESKSVFIIM